MRHLVFAALLGATALPVSAEDAWDSIALQLYGDRALLDGGDVIAIDAPYRTQNDSRTQIAAMVRAPEGLNIGTVTLVLDENPMPVSAVFALETPLPSFFFDVTMRVNGPTPLHVVAETTDGRLWMAEGFVKTSGQGACAAPPGTDPKEALATLGEMELELADLLPGADAKGRLEALATRQKRLDVDISHPSHSGMQMDQISLLYIPMRYVKDVQIDLDGAGYVDVTGSISLSENPRLGLSVPGRTRSVDVTMTDTDGTVTTAHKDIAGF
ncbi:quinoprotein dehydrogenase-associated SoxYZ-like carrier (plasmid) [Sagittula sp. P11]|uniref:quinoprotein dehydrogenase-associated SoxYZ-like carrier n=1 Tax=Sagittula sp. P11 TaxID=2009329 RepID=UPI000C2D2674|nr:quinoprotein dehydrogenase-associated SoxYZ-like carrier [Sagittula sp. P11]AUC56113.1 quinoprotein dehydrogenase-associated SoxYZ-like carrier [Sagittula sp. P11]